MFDDAHDFRLDRGEFTHVAGDYHQHTTTYSPGTPVNNVGNVTNANFGVNYGTISQTSGTPSPAPSPPVGYQGLSGPPGPPRGYWPPQGGYHEPPPHHGPPYPQGGYWNGPRQGPQPRYGPPPPHQSPPPPHPGYSLPQNRSPPPNQQGGYNGGNPYQRGPAPNRPPQQPPQQLPHQRRHTEQPLQQQSDRGSRGPSPAPRPDGRYPLAPDRVYSAPPPPQPNQGPRRQETFDDVYAEDYSNPPSESQNQPSSSRTKHRTPPPVVDSDSENEDVEMEETRHHMNSMHITEQESTFASNKAKRNWMGMKKKH